jgi:ADP-heptose:LPS heptosyltransferase/O-antigen ligase
MPLPRTELALQRLDRTALIATLLTVPMLLHAHAFAEATMGVASACFLVRSALTHDWRWLRSVWFRIGVAWWAWIVLCSAPFPVLGLGLGGTDSLVQALATLRFLLFVAALEFAVLCTKDARRWLHGLIMASAVYIAIHSLFQSVTGFNLYGQHRGGDGELTGPFGKPRAGPPESRILFPALVPPVASLLARNGWRSTVGAYTLLFSGVGIVVLIGQRMPLLLTLLGLFVTAVLLPKLRPVVLAACVAGAALLAATVVVSPPTYYRLVLKFSSQMDHFPTSAYGQIYTRALEIGRQHPLFGRGYDGFRTGCPMPRYFRPTLDGRIADGGGTANCAAHPHNFFMEALDNGGIPGLALFIALSLAWLWPLGTGLWSKPNPLRVGLFASVLIQLWPIASTSAFTSMPMGGWFFLLLGWGLAETRWQTAPLPPCATQTILPSSRLGIIQPLPGIGDMVWHLPHIRAIAGAAGHQVTLIVKPRSAADQIFAAEDTIADILWMDRNPDGRQGAHDGAPGLLRLITTLRSHELDSVVILHHSRTLAFAAMAAGIPRRYGYGYRWQRPFMNCPPYLPQSALRLHPYQQATEYLRAASIAVADAEPRLTVAPTARAAVAARLAGHPSPMVAVGISTSEPYKQWGAERFASLARALLDAGWQTLVLVGGPAEAEIAEAITAHMPEGHARIVAALGWTLSDIAALFEASGFYVGNDTGVMNMAAAVGIRTYALFGATPPFAHASAIVPITPPDGRIDKNDGMARIDLESVIGTIIADREFLGPGAC